MVLRSHKTHKKSHSAKDLVVNSDTDQSEILLSVDPVTNIQKSTIINGQQLNANDIFTTENNELDQQLLLPKQTVPKTPNKTGKFGDTKKGDILEKCISRAHLLRACKGPLTSNPRAKSGDPCEPGPSTLTPSQTSCGPVPSRLECSATSERSKKRSRKSQLPQKKPKK